MLRLLEKAEQTHQLTKEEIVELLSEENYDEALFASADRVRRSFVGDGVHLRGLIEFSNICKQNCLYCGLRRDNKKIRRYRLTSQEIIDFAAKAVQYGYKTVVLQSGEDDSYDVDTMTTIIRQLKEMELAVTLSLGEKSRADYAAYKAAGADRYLLRIETSDRELYEKLDPGQSWDNRYRCLLDLKELGFELGTGCLVGLPGQSLESIADDILLFAKLDADMVGIGPFIANPDTPLAQAENGAFALSRKVMALTRLLLPEANIPATTAMEALHPQGRILALQSGANVVMPNVTEGEYRKMYLLYPGKICLNDTPAHCRGCITGKINGIGRHVATDFGFRNKKNK
ncbi:[FeFe] hydrogenase H-cluster radical SAM maturase HydE [Azotosporobacter soli]|uniref:[FeFe] hydrogenase H-cluster radical SAM maturase HydE n=1 Tax=Azotosporobacter soli TaxID=3055040 RepID=UPI0031FE80F6